MRLPDGRTLELTGNWTFLPVLPGERALLYRSDVGAREAHRFALDAWSATLRVLHTTSKRQLAWWDHGSAWTADGVFIEWVDVYNQLVARDVRSGAATSLTALPTSVISYEVHRGLVPRPMNGSPVVNEESQQVLFLCRDKTLEFSWGLGAGQFGWRTVADDGLTLLAAALDGSGVSTLAKGLPAPGCRDWTVATGRQRLLLLRGVEAADVEIRTLSGEYERTLSAPWAEAWKLRLDPQEQRAVVERRPGFAVLDLDSGEVVALSETGHACSWSPDGSTLAYRDGPELRLFDVATSSSTLLASLDGEPGPYLTMGNMQPPAWSSDGRWLAGGVGVYWRDEEAVRNYTPGTEVNYHSQTVLLDLQQHLAVVLLAEAFDPTWAEDPEPFVRER